MLALSARHDSHAIDIDYLLQAQTQRPIRPVIVGRLLRPVGRRKIRQVTAREVCHFLHLVGESIPMQIK